jgi:hypothetical protein
MEAVEKGLAVVQRKEMFIISTSRYVITCYVCPDN